MENKHTVSKSSLDVRENLIQRLLQDIPEIATDGKVDLEKLKNILENKVEESTERYNFSWNGT